MKGLIIKSPWIELILEGKKTWEIRGSNTKIRGPIALIKSGSGMVYGEVNVRDSKELTLKDYQVSNEFHRVQSESLQALPYKKTFAWVLEKPRIYKEPIPYKHPMGAVIWVNLKERNLYDEK
ncbi:ASCH domain-containing protein [Rossellomorea vietnamensis]|uniref:ASCH domain-containing protein n=1 Tax=Rossellomorea vietnamensis TaxID=218284 RepID=A0A6I6UI57_9BACI|nr:ASCH domain-containing protein [Rossellomorea vietnamensis]QHE62565.1 ASCH domain-containing protein [Rossellomorea vietnamensis]